jgi:hypothetical protein
VSARKPKTNLARKLDIAQIALIVIGFLIGAGAARLSLAPVIGVGVAIAGLGVLVGGLGDVLTRSVNYADYDFNRDNRFIPFQSYRGVPAVLFGVFWVMLGALAVAGGLAYAAGVARPALELLRAHPSVPLLGIGLPLFFYGSATLMGPTETSPRRSFGLFLVSLPERLGGLFLVVVGVAAIAAGCAEIVAPGTLARLLGSLRSLLPQVPR